MIRKLLSKTQVIACTITLAGIFTDLQAQPYISHDTPVAFCGGDSVKLYVMYPNEGSTYQWYKADQGALSVVGTKGFSKAGVDKVSMVTSTDGTPYVAYVDKSAGNKATVMMYAAGSWIPVGNEGVSDSSAESVSLAISNDGTLFIAFTDNSVNKKATVLMYSDNTWIPVGYKGFSSGSAKDISLAIDRYGRPVVAFIDGAFSNKLTVMKYNGQGWFAISGEGISLDEVLFPKVAVDVNNNPCVVFSDAANSYGASVMYYNGDFWEDVGSTNFSGGLAEQTNIALYNNVAYVSYKDALAKGWVYAFNGETWQALGGKPFSPSLAFDPALAIDAEGNPVVSFADSEKNNKATVMRYRNGKWVVLEKSGVSNDQALGGAISITPNGEIFIGFKDHSISDKTTVMKFAETSIGNGEIYVVDSTGCYYVAETPVEGPVTQSPKLCVDVYPKLEISVKSSLPFVCKGESVILTASGAPNFYWTRGVTNGIAFIPDSTDTYSVTASDENGCKATAKQTIQVRTKAVISASASATKVCRGTPVKLQGSGGVSYSWTDGKVLITNDEFFKPDSSRTYVVTGSGGNGCSGKDSIRITILNLPKVTAKISSLAVCEGEGVTLKGEGADQYQWNNGVADGVEFVPVSSKTYNVFGVDTNGCKANFTTPAIIVVDKSTAVVNADGPASFCEGGKVNLLATAVGGATYLWSNGAITQGITVTQAGDYSVKISVKGCSSESTPFQVVSNPLPKADFTTTAAGPQIKFINTSVNALSYNWSFGIGNSSIEKGPNHFYPSDGDYSVKLKVFDINNCADSIVKKVTVKTFSVSGNVYGEQKKNNVSDGKVFLWLFNINTLLFEKVDSAQITVNGTYKFNRIGSGKYLLLAVPVKEVKQTLFPSYYKGFANWDSATVLNLDSILTGINIPLEQNFVLSGKGRITGSVTQLINGTPKRQGAGSPLKGILVSLVDNSADTSVAYTLTDDNGEFEFNNIPDGTYSLIPDVPGVPVDLQYNSFTIGGADTAITNVEIIRDSTHLYVPGAVGIKSVQYKTIAKLYPNPANNFITMELSADENSLVSVKIFNLLGKEISSEPTNISNGKNFIRLNTSHFPEGIYFVGIRDKNGKYQLSKFVIAR